MKRQLLWVLVVASICAGCAARPVSEANGLASDIVNGRSSNATCMSGDLKYCEVDADGSRKCACIDHRSLFPVQR
jgi:hypothetical protein